MTPEESAAWLRGEDNWLAHITDPELKAKVERQQQATQAAFWGSVDLFIKALEQDSEQTCGRLKSLRDSAKGGDQYALQMIWVMLGELASTAFGTVR